MAQRFSSCRVSWRSAGSRLRVKSCNALLAAGGINRDRAQQVAQLRGAGCVEGAVSAAGEARDLLEGAPRVRILALVEQEHGQSEHAQLAREVA